MSVSRQMSFLLISRSFHSELLQYNFLPLDPAAFGFCQGRSVPGSLPEIINKLATAGEIVPLANQHMLPHHVLLHIATIKVHDTQVGSDVVNWNGCA
ncbi:hypothetical protein V6N12_050457 [Hibiscus sabdariffa]|uniref:Uncharacterized protein n=1 Tax=Hibiscus sabdariffa TaxID=183260 RepID=A0ABR2GE68_9ROSI